jgi:lysine-specific permease
MNSVEAGSAVITAERGGASEDQLHRGIESRQLSMIAIGGAIGTGLFFASGSAISHAGPGGAMVAYAVMGLAVFCMMQSLGEMATQLPIRGSFETYAERFVDSSFAFAVGWNYWFSWAITLAAELVAGALIVKFWFPHSNSAIWAGTFLALLLALNLLSVRAYAEAEYWFSSIKVGTVLIFLVVGGLMIAGILGGPVHGFGNWSLHDPASGGQAPFVGGWSSVLAVFMVAGFAFQGTEGVGLAAAETTNPAKNVPKAIRSVFWRILLFYIGSIFVVGTLIPFNDPNLLHGDEGHVALSPYTLVFVQVPAVGYYAASLMNAVILTAVLSCGNSSMYVASRMLHAMAHSGKAPRVCARLTRRGVPALAITITAMISALTFFASTIGDQKIYALFYNASSLSGFLIWLGIAICHIRFRRAWAAQGRPLSELTFRARFYPVGTWLALVIFVVVILFANMGVFQASPFSWFDFITSYMMIPVCIGLYLWHKIRYKTRLVPMDRCDFEAGLNERSR